MTYRTRGIFNYIDDQIDDVYARAQRDHAQSIANKAFTHKLCTCGLWENADYLKKFGVCWTCKEATEPRVYHNVTECKHCNADATVMSYRERDGIVSGEVVCDRCHFSTNESLRWFGIKFKEGDDYWAVQTFPEPEALGTIGEPRPIYIEAVHSCWDDQSEEICNDYHQASNNLRSLEDVIAWSISQNIDEIRVSTMMRKGHPSSYAINIEEIS